MKLKIGKTKYDVVTIDTFQQQTLTRGRIKYAPVNMIEIARRAGVPLRKRTKAGEKHTFWHEAVHGMLYEMGSSKYKDEAFVDELATLIQQVNSQVKDLYV